jgi:hypothetical protein
VLNLIEGKSRGRIALAVAMATAALVGACGQPVNTSSGATASATRTQSPSAIPSPTTSPAIPDARLLTASNCSAAAPTTAPRQLDRYYTIRPAPDWTDTSNYFRDDTLLLELTAPINYGFSPTRVQFRGGAVGPVHILYGAGASAHSIAQQKAAAIAQETSPNAVAGTISDCTVGGEAAAAYGFSNGTLAGFYLYFIHNDGLEEVLLAGTGGISDQAIHDSLAMLASLVWVS